MILDMCDLFGMSCNESDRATRSLPRFAASSAVNRHGWGIGWFEGNTAEVNRAPERADFSAQYEESTAMARSHTIVAHLRYSTVGEPCECNCHPFKWNHRGRDWLLAHNGHVRGTSPHPLAEGDTDSERIFIQIMEKVGEYQEGGRIRGQIPALKKAIRHIFDTYDTDINLNLLISDGHHLYVFHHYPGKPIYMLERSKQYGGAVLVSTVPLSDEGWVPLAPDRLLVINRGEIQLYSDPLI